MAVHRSAYNLAGEQVFDSSKIQPAIAGFNVGDIGHPRLVWRGDFNELPVKQVRGDWQVVFAIRGRFVLADMLTAQPKAFA